MLSRRPSDLFIISILGALSVISPFAIDMYLPAFPQVEQDLGVSGATIALTISSYFIGLALGQVFYGPLLDRYGRKKPLYAGLGLFVIMSVLCAMVPTVQILIGLRFVQALGGCVAGVASLAIVHDLFPPEDGAKILSRLFLFIAVSPMLAPSVGGALALWLGWKAVFLLLGVIAAGVIALVHVFLPESHQPDPGISLKPWPIIVEYGNILRHPRFATYALAGSFTFAGLFTYVAGSPIVFMEGFHLSARAYSGVFAFLSVGFIGGSQVNLLALKRWKSETIFLGVTFAQAIIGLLFVAGTWAGWFGLSATIAMLFAFLACTGMTYPNAAALAIMPFSRNAGSASAMLGFLQLGVGALISTSIGAFVTHDSLPVIAVLAATTMTGLMIALAGRGRAAMSSATDEDPAPAAHLIP